MVSPSDQVVWERLALIDESQGLLDNAFSAIDRASALDAGVKRVWMERAAIAEKMGKDEEVLKSYDGALALDPNDAIAWNGKGLVLLRQGSYANAMRALQKALELDPAMQSAQEGIDQAERELHKVEVSEHASRVLDMESRQGRRLNKEETFRSCQVPYEMLDEVSAYIEQKEVMDVTQLTDAEMEMYEEASHTVLLNAYRNPSVTAYGLKLADVRASLPGYDLVTAKRVYTYIETVNGLDLSREMPDDDVQAMLRRAVDLPDDRRSVIALMETFDLGIYKARRLKAAMNALRSIGSLEAAPKAKKKTARPKLRRTPAPARPQYGPEPMTVAPPRMEEPDMDEPVEAQAPDAVFLPPAEPVESSSRRQSATRDPLLYTNNERELYSAFYGSRQAVQDRVRASTPQVPVPRRERPVLLPGVRFAALQQCVTSGTCPRCQTQVRVKPLNAPRPEEGQAAPRAGTGRDRAGAHRTRRGTGLRTGEAWSRQAPIWKRMRSSKERDISRL